MQLPGHHDRCYEEGAMPCHAMPCHVMSCTISNNTRVDGAVIIVIDTAPAAATVDHPKPNPNQRTAVFSNTLRIQPIKNIKRALRSTE